MTKSPRRVEIFGHRGAPLVLPENCLAGFARARKEGATALESDVHLTRDGHVVLSHDATGERMAGVKKAIRDSELSEVSTWDIGWGYLGAAGGRPFAEQGHHIPTLDALLEAHPGVFINLDIKQRSPDMVGPLIVTIRRHAAEHRVLLTSFFAEVRKGVRAQRYAGPIGLGRRELLRVLFAPLDGLRDRPGLGHRAQVPVRAGLIRFASQRFIHRCHELGIMVDFWTVNDLDEARRLIELGADGIMTDTPAIMRGLFEEDAEVTEP